MNPLAKLGVRVTSYIDQLFDDEDRAMTILGGVSVLSFGLIVLSVLLALGVVK